MRFLSFATFIGNAFVETSRCAPSMWRENYIDRSADPLNCLKMEERRICKITDGHDEILADYNFEKYTDSLYGLNGRHWTQCGCDESTGPNLKKIGNLYLYKVVEREMEVMLTVRFLCNKHRTWFHRSNPHKTDKYERLADTKSLYNSCLLLGKR